MPTTVRLLGILGLLFGAGYAVLYLLANTLDPAPRETIAVVPPARYAK